MFMQKLTFAAAIFALLAGCAGNGGFLGMRGSGTGGDGGEGTRAPRYTGATFQYDQRFWPPVVEGQAFPPQHMWAD